MKESTFQRIQVVGIVIASVGGIVSILSTLELLPNLTLESGADVTLAAPEGTGPRRTEPGQPTFLSAALGVVALLSGLIFSLFGYRSIARHEQATRIEANLHSLTIQRSMPGLALGVIGLSIILFDILGRDISLTAGDLSAANLLYAGTACVIGLVLAYLGYRLMHLREQESLELLTNMSAKVRLTALHGLIYCLAGAVVVVLALN